MLTLDTGQTFSGKAGTTAVINYTISKDLITTGDSFTPTQGVLTNSTATLYTSTGGQSLVKEIQLTNTSASQVSGITFYIIGTAGTNQWGPVLTIPASGGATYDGEGKWSIYGSDGIVLTTIGGAAGGDLSGSYPNPQIATGVIVNTDISASAGIDATKIADGTVTSAEFQFINSVTSNVQTQIDGKQPLDSDLTTIAGLTATTDNFMQAKASAWSSRTPTQVTADLDGATFLLKGLETATEHINLNSINGQTSSGTNKRIFRPGDYMVGNTYDPTGSSNSTSSFTAMIAAIVAFADRSMIELPPGVFKIDNTVFTGLTGASIDIIGPGRGTCILLPTATGTLITLPPSMTGADAITLRGFTIYNTSGTPYTSGAGILTNGCDAVDITEVAFVDLFNDIQVSGSPYTMTTNGTTAISGVSPSLVAGDVGKPVSGPGITPGTTLSAQAGTTGTLSGAATVSTTDVRFLGNSIKVSMQKIVSFNTNSNGSGVGILVNNGQAGDTYIGPDIVMSDGGGTTRRRACVEIVESGHYEITQCNLTGSQRGILIDPGASQSAAFGFHTNVLCDSNTINGMQMNSSTATSTIKNIKSVNSWYSGTTVINGSAAAAGVLTAGSGILNGVTFSNDRFLNNRTHGFEHGKGTDFRFVDCDMKGNSSSGSGNADGLNVAAGVSNWSINGGKFGGTDTVPTAGNQRYGINIAAGAGDFIKIGPDDLSGNVTGPLSNGATGTNVFVNGCPGLPAPYARGAISGSISTVITIANTLIPKNSVRIGTTFRITAALQHITTLGTDTFTVRIGTTNDAVGSAATNAVVVTAIGAGGAANDWCKVEFLATISAITASGNINAQGAGIKNITPFSTATAARASGAGFLAVDTTADKYLTLAVAASAGADLVYTSTIEVVNY